MLVTDVDNPLGRKLLVFIVAWFILIAMEMKIRNHIQK